jgi:hypothetical protein
MTSDRTFNVLIVVALVLLVAAGGLAVSLIANDEHLSITLGQ